MPDFGKLHIIIRGAMPIGKVACMLDNKIVWYGRLADPWDDINCDTICVSKEDYEQVVRMVAAKT
jgi:hypothetical protein